MKLSEDLTWRGLIKDKTFDDVDMLDQPKTFYWGVDCSADSLTVGNLAPLLLAKRLASAGWKAVLLVGGATSLIGDPGGKDAERPLLPREQVQANVAAIKTQVARLFGDQQFELVDNYDWFRGVGYLDFLRDVGKHFSMTELLQREFIAERMGEHGSGISYAEFSYSLVQGYDFWNLYKTKQAVMQIGGSDQWGNMLSGVALIRKKEAAEAHAMSMPLVINKATGKKFGKSEEGTLWLDPAKTTPTKFYQFWINLSDEDAGENLKVFTFLSKEDIEETLSNHASNPGHRYAQRIIAHHVTALVHGQESAGLAEEMTDIITDRSNLEVANDRAFEALKNEINSTTASPGSGIVNALVDSGLASSNSEARRLIQSGGIYINGENIIRESFQENDFKNGRLILRRGKAYKDSALILNQ